MPAGRTLGEYEALAIKRTATLARDKGALGGSLDLSERLRRIAEARGWCTTAPRGNQALDQAVPMILKRLEGAAEGTPTAPTVIEP